MVAGNGSPTLPRPNPVLQRPIPHCKKPPSDVYDGVYTEWEKHEGGVKRERERKKELRFRHARLAEALAEQVRSAGPVC